MRIWKAVLASIIFLAVIQAARFGMKQIFFLFSGKTVQTDRLASMVAMLILTAIILLIARRYKKQVAFFPDKFGACYWIGTGIYAGLFILTPVLTQEADLQSFILLFYGSMVVPLFEEIIFRGLLWNGLQKVIGRAWVVYLVTSALFALWHLGYVDSLALHTEENLSNVLFWKAIVGLFYGLVLGVLRLKTKNCYSTFLLHGILNIFGR